MSLAGPSSRAAKAGAPLGDRWLVDFRAGPRTRGPARRYQNYERAGWAFSGSQMLMWRVSGMMNRQMTKHTAGTTMG